MFKRKFKKFCKFCGSVIDEKGGCPWYKCPVNVVKRRREEKEKEKEKQDDNK